VNEEARRAEALRKLKRRVLTPKDLLAEYDDNYFHERMGGMTPEAAHLLAIAAVNARTERIREQRRR
jgi:hypothetical protein